MFKAIIICYRHPFLLEASEVALKRKLQFNDNSIVEEDLRNDVDDNDMSDLENRLISMNIDNKDSSNIDALKKVRPDASVFEIADRNPDLYELFQVTLVNCFD